MRDLSLHSQGLQVRQLQELLNSFLTEQPPLKTDGIFGPKTQSRVMAFQKQAKLAADGVVGPKTNKALVGSVLAENING
jgi:peptidoglycan hydrolase-like protein with peptidoglycan-binding domain